ncbi:MAG: hypothetical protein JWL59_764 [Chthoniobacteraceae bacterium]|nr:hypothetical protein [Chthoniobacteraceae bacterium]
MIRLAIIGAGALGQQIAQHARQSRLFEVTGFFDDTRAIGEATQEGAVLGPLPAIAQHHHAGAFDELLLGIGYHHLAARERIFEELAPHVPFARFIHPAACVDSSVRLGPGIFVSAGCILDLNAELAANVFLYPGCVIAHDSLIGAHSFLAPAVRVAGRVRVGRRCFLGIGTTVVDDVSLADDVSTGAGAVVVCDLPDAGTYVGVPARRLR